MHMNHPDKLGSAVWADPQDIAQRYRYRRGESFWLGRNPYDYDQTIGIDDDRHVFLCSGTRGGKGRSIILPNLLRWRGSVVSVDPKGENASIAAARRANGNEYCEGMGQKTYVLDPYGRADVPDELRASCNLLDILDPESGSLLSEAESLAEAMRVTQQGGESESWSKAGAEITALVIAHVRTFDGLPDEHRNLVTVREWLCAGQTLAVDAVKNINKKRLKEAKAAGEEADLLAIPDPFEMLFKDMERNSAQRGAIARRAKSYLSLMRTNARQYGSLIQNARSETNFVDDLQMEDSLTGSSAGGRSFNISDLKNDADGISVFICLPDKPSHPAVRWQKALITLILDRMQEDQNLPATGRPILMCLDEFASMGKMERIGDGMNSIAGAGVKLFIAVTQIGKLKKLYGEAWSEFLAGSSIHIWFQIDDLETRKHIEQAFGDAQIVLRGRTESVARSKQTGTTESTAESQGESYSEAEAASRGQTEGTSHARTVGHNLSTSVTDAENFSRTTGRSRSNTKGNSSSWQLSKGFGRGSHSSTAHGHSSGMSHNEWLFFKPLVKSTNEGRNTQHTSGGNTNTSENKSKGGGTNQSRTISVQDSQTVGGSTSTTQQQGSSESETDTRQSSTTNTLSETYTRGRSQQTTQTTGTTVTEGETITEGMQTSFQKRPLITVAEINRYLKRIDEREDLAYPGFALVHFSGEDPFLVRKCYYDEDAEFENCFTPHYRFKHDFLPFSKQRLVGGQYTDQHFLPLRLPLIALEVRDAIDVVLKRSTDRWFDQGEELFEWTAPTLDANTARFVKATAPVEPILPGGPSPDTIPYMSVEDRVGRPRRSTEVVAAPADGKVIDIALQPAFFDDGDIMFVRLERAINDRERAELQASVFEGLLGYLKQNGLAQGALDALIDALNKARNAAWEKIQEEQDQLAEAKRQAEEAYFARRKREEDEERRRRDAAAQQEAAAEKRKRQIFWAKCVGGVVAVLVVLNILDGIFSAIATANRTWPEPYVTVENHSITGFKVHPTHLYEIDASRELILGTVSMYTSRGSITLAGIQTYVLVDPDDDIIDAPRLERIIERRAATGGWTCEIYTADTKLSRCYDDESRDLAKLLLQTDPLTRFESRPSYGYDHDSKLKKALDQEYRPFQHEMPEPKDYLPEGLAERMTFNPTGFSRFQPLGAKLPGYRTPEGKSNALTNFGETRRSQERAAQRASR